MAEAVDGILLIDKGEGETSYHVVRKVKDVFPGHKVGHAGTLDPFATGLLVILLNKGTKISRFLMAQDKIYQATVRLGEETDTLDPTGKVTARQPVPSLSKARVEQVAKGFVGEIEQVPPVFSALKVQGKRAYEIARKGGTVRLKPRRVTIYQLKVLDMARETVELEIHCSSGTYIRTLASDFSKALGTCGHLVQLRRIASGSFTVLKAIPSAEISRDRERGLREAVIPLNQALDFMPELDIAPRLAEKIRHGYQPEWSDLGEKFNPAHKDQETLRLVCKGKLVALLSIQPSSDHGEGWLKLEKVFPES